jgi:hypothetical protein
LIISVRVKFYALVKLNDKKLYIQVCYKLGSYHFRYLGIPLHFRKLTNAIWMGRQ